MLITKSDRPMSQSANELKKRVQFKLMEILSEQATAAQNLSGEDLMGRIEAIVPDANQLLNRAEDLDPLLQQQWEAAGKPYENMATWLRQAVGVSLADSPNDILDKAEAYLKR